MEKHSLQNQPSNNSKINYYDDRSKRSIDIFLGLGLGLLIYIFGMFGILGKHGIWVTIAVYILSILFFFYKKRHYISIGLFMMVAVPVVIFGGCLLLFGGFKI
jgi:hypothetical protein